MAVKIKFIFDLHKKGIKTCWISDNFKPLEEVSAT